MTSDLQPWRIDVPMQSHPVSPPPITTTFLPLAEIGGVNLPFCECPPAHGHQAAIWCCRAKTPSQSERPSGFCPGWVDRAAWSPPSPAAPHQTASSNRARRSPSAWMQGCSRSPQDDSCVPLDGRSGGRRRSRPQTRSSQTSRPRRHQVDPSLHRAPVQLHIRNAVHQKPADPIRRSYTGDIVTRLVQLDPPRRAPQARCPQSAIFCPCVIDATGGRSDPAFLKTLVDDRALECS